MNPLIEKFWENVGYKVIPWRSAITESDRRYLWCLFKNDTYIRVIGVSEYFTGLQRNIKCSFYYFNDQTYSEEDMIKIIKMKAFI